MKSLAFVAATSCVLAFSACGDSGGSTDQEGEVSNVPCGSCSSGEFCSNDVCVEDPGLIDGGTATCDMYSFSETGGAALARKAGGKTRLRMVTTNVVTEMVAERPAFDKLVLEINQDALYGEGDGVGTYDLVGSENRTNALYMRGHRFCNDFDCAFPYIVERGTLEITSGGAPGTMFEGVFRDVILKQVRIDAQTGDIIPFSNGKTWCMGDVSFSHAVDELSNASGDCVADGTGINVGDNIRNFTLRNCDGEMIDLHSYCGQSKALWMVASAGWCGACEAFVPEAWARYQELQDDGLELLVVVGEDNFGNEPTLEYCTAYATGKGMDPALTFIDHDGTQSWPNLFTHINTYSGGSIGLPWNVVLNGNSMEYVWSSNTGEGDLYGAQRTLLEAD
ncbi:MAG: hypothetical protein ACI9MR_000640 [Myxococcota bacterium]|jgi:hypothetical protein